MTTRRRFFPLPPSHETEGLAIASRATRDYVESELSDTGDIRAAAILTNGNLLTWDGEALGVFSPGIADAACSFLLDQLGPSPASSALLGTAKLVSSTDRKAA